MVIRLGKGSHNPRSTGQAVGIIFFLCTAGTLIGGYRGTQSTFSDILGASPDDNVLFSSPVVKATGLQTNGNVATANEIVSKSSASSGGITGTRSKISWPQVDDRIGEALRNGHSIMPTITYTDASRKEYMFNNTKYEAPPEKLATVVTCIYEARSKHPGAFYVEWFSNMLHVTDPLIVFLDPIPDQYSKIDWYELVRSKRQHAPTIIVKLPFTNLTMETQFDESFWLTQLPPPFEVKRQKGYRVYNEKILLIKEAAVLNPFNTEHFIWVDAGYYRGNNRPVHGVIVRNNITKNGVPPNKIMFPQMYNTDSMQEIAANVWGGTREAILETNEKYWIAFWDMVTKGLKVSFEQRVMVTMCRTWPDFCYQVYSGRDEDWFKLGKSWLRDPNTDFRKYEFPTFLNDGDASGIWDKRKNTILPTTIVKEPVVFPEDKVTGDVIAKYYTKGK
jgi:hypothetical protein